MSSKIGNGRKRPYSKEIGDYLRKKQKKNKVTISELVKAVRPTGSTVAPEKTINNLLERDYLPTYYSYFKRICNTLEVEEEKIAEWGETDPAFLYSYFDELRPDAPDIDKIGILIREKDRDYTIYDVAEGTGLQLSSISRLEYLINAISYESFLKFCDFYKVKPIDFLNEFASYPDSVKATELIPGYISNGLEAAEIPMEDAAEILGYSEERFQKLFYGKTKYFIDDLEKFAIYLGLSAETFNNIIQRAYLCGYSAPLKEASKTGVLPEGERRVTELSNILLQYKTVSDRKFVVETHTLLTLIYLILFSKNSDKYRMEIMYYIEHLTDSGELYKNVVNIEDEWAEFDGIQIFDEVRKMRGISHRQLGNMIGSSNSHTIKICTKNIRMIPERIEKISEAVQLSPTVLLEGYLENKEAEKEEASIWDVVATIQATVVWNLDGETVSTNTLADICRILYNRKLSAKQKYNEIKKLKFE